MAIGDISKFEEKLRDVEKRLGVTENVAISFERGTDLAGRMLFSLIATGVIIAILSKMKGFKGPINMDSFVSILLISMI